MSKTSRLARWGLLLLLVTLLTSVVYAQDARGTVLGRVTDSSGASIASVEVRITNQNTGVAASAKTNEAGNFVFIIREPGEVGAWLRQARC